MPADDAPTLRNHHQPDPEPDQLSFDDDLIDYWRQITRTWEPLERDQLTAIAAIVAGIDERRAATRNGDDPRERPPRVA
ncbi:hypothetical protein [Nocardia heshunensis]